MAPGWTGNAPWLQDCTMGELDRLIRELERFIPAAEESLRTGRRITEPLREMTPHGRRRRQTELAQAREALVTVRGVLAARRDGESWLRRQLEELGKGDL